MELIKLFTILSLLGVIILFSCEESNDDSPTIEITGPSNIFGVDESVVDEIVNTLKEDSEYIRVTPIMPDSEISQFHFIFGMKDCRLWLNVYDSDWCQINEHLSPIRIENKYHIGYGEYGELCDVFLSGIHYRDNVKFLEIYIIYQSELKYIIRCQSIFVDNNDFIIVNDRIIADNLTESEYKVFYLYEQYSQYSFIYNIRPAEVSKFFMKPWINNSFLYLNVSNNRLGGGGYSCVCYNLVDYTTLYESAKRYSGLTSFEIENAINCEEVIINHTNLSTIERFNIKNGDVKWSINIKDTYLLTSDAKCLSLNIVDKMDKRWKFVGEWILYDGTHKVLEFIVDIDKGEYSM